MCRARYFIRRRLLANPINTRDCGAFVVVTMPFTLRPPLLKFLVMVYDFFTYELSALWQLVLGGGAGAWVVGGGATVVGAGPTLELGTALY